MTKQKFALERKRLLAANERLLKRRNARVPESNGWFIRYRQPVLTAAHTPVAWRYDLNQATNPLLMERLGINAVFNVGAMDWHGHVVLMARVEGVDRKSFFAVALCLVAVAAAASFLPALRIARLNAAETLRQE